VKERRQGIGGAGVRRVRRVERLDVAQHLHPQRAASISRLRGRGTSQGDGKGRKGEALHADWPGRAVTSCFIRGAWPGSGGLFFIADSMAVIASGRTKSGQISGTSRRAKTWNGACQVARLPGRRKSTTDFHSQWKPCFRPMTRGSRPDGGYQANPEMPMPVRNWPIRAGRRLSPIADNSESSVRSAEQLRLPLGRRSSARRSRSQA